MKTYENNDNFWLCFQSKEEKVMFAVTGCFSSVIAVAEVTQEHEDVLEIDTKVW